MELEQCDFSIQGLKFSNLCESQILILNPIQWTRVNSPPPISCFQRSLKTHVNFFDYLSLSQSRNYKDYNRNNSVIMSQIICLALAPKIVINGNLFCSGSRGWVSRIHRDEHSIQEGAKDFHNSQHNKNPGLIRVLVEKSI